MTSSSRPSLPPPAIALGDVGDVLRDDAHAERGKRSSPLPSHAGVGVAERRRVGDLRRSARWAAARTICSTCARLEGRGGLEVGIVDREGADLDRDLAVDLGAVDLVVGAGDRGRRRRRRREPRCRRRCGCAIVGRHLLAIASSLGGQGRVDLGEGPELDEVALALAGDRAHLDDLAARDFLLDRADAVALLAEDDVGRIGGELGEGVGQRGELVGIVEGRHQGGAHQGDRGDAGEDRAGEPAPAIRRGGWGSCGFVVLAADDQRRIVAEIDRPGGRAVRDHAKAGRPPHDRPLLPDSADARPAVPEIEARPCPPRRIKVKRKRRLARGAEKARAMGHQCGWRVRRSAAKKTVNNSAFTVLTVL